MNGGVSLAVWIGGATHEVDCLRRAAGASNDELASEPTTRVYRELLKILRERVIVDVIAGASAGGINGALLGAAVFAQRPLPPLRDVWITVGDFERLLRSPMKSQPPSLLRGDDFVLPQLEERFNELLRGAGGGPDDQPIHLYITATDFYGVPKVFADSTHRRFQELDHRRVFQFQHVPGSSEEADSIEETERNAQAEPNAERPGATSASTAASERDKSAVMPGSFCRFDSRDAPNLLAQAARSSSSFPVAFEAHGMKVRGEAEKRWLIDGGVLDNQPFNPVLNRIATLPGRGLPIRRVLGYIVPYVTEAGSGPLASGPGDEQSQPTAKQTAGAAGSLPRDLPKLVDLERVRSEMKDAERAARERDRFNALNREDLASVADLLFDTYRDTRRHDSVDVFRQWASPTFRPGLGEVGQLESLDWDLALTESPPPIEAGEVADPLWVPRERSWVAGRRWQWGLGPSERIAADALAHLRELEPERLQENDVVHARVVATELVAKIRLLKFRTAESFIRMGQPTLEERAQAVYWEVVDELTTAFEELAVGLAELARRDEEASPPQQPTGENVSRRRKTVPPLQCLIDAEVVQNAFSVDRATVPPIFDFIHMSAGIRNALGHPDSAPELKLSGMKLNHFAGFLKRSWRANDWLWGRLDSVQYLVAAVFDARYIKALHDDSRDELFEALRDFAFPDEHNPALASAWQATLRWADSRDDLEPTVQAQVSDVLQGLPKTQPSEAFIELLSHCADEARHPRVRDALLDCCRSAMSARIQLGVLDEELPEVALAIRADLDHGASRASSGADWVTKGVGETAQEQVAQFHRLRIGKEESPFQEASSKLGMDVLATGAAVATAAFSGSRGGLPGALRALLASARGVTLVFSIAVRLLVRTPAIGIAAVIAAAVAVVWALAQPNTLLGAALPGLAALAIGGMTVLIVMATSPLEARCRSVWQKFGLLLIIALPVALLLFVLGLPFGIREHLPILQSFDPQAGDASSWISGKTTPASVDIAACFMVAVLATACIRVFIGSAPRKARLVDLWLYRWCLLLAAGSIAGGAVYARISGQEHNWSGTILFLILFGAISLAPLMAELAAGGRWTAQRLGGAVSSWMP